MALKDMTQDAVAILRAGAAMGSPRLIEPTACPYTIVPDGMTVVDLSHLLPAPRAVLHRVTVGTVPAFVAAVTRFPTRHPVLFGCEASGTIVAVMDFSTDSQPLWGRHLVTLRLDPSPEWLTWTKASGQQKTQIDFARFLEDNLPDIAEPPGADVLQMAQSLEVKKAVQFASSVRLDNGQHQLTYTEDISGSSTKGTLQIVDRFTLGLSPWRATPLYKVEARLRYRMQDGKVVFWVDLLRPHKVVEAAWQDVVQTVETELSRTFQATGAVVVLPGVVS